MRKRTVRSGMRLVMAVLILIILASFYHIQLSDLFLLSPAGEYRIYSLGMLLAAAIGCYGVIMIVLGLVLSPIKNDINLRILPAFIGISTLMLLFFYLLSSSIEAPDRDHRRVRPGEAITI